MRGEALLTATRRARKVVGHDSCGTSRYLPGRSLCQEEAYPACIRPNRFWRRRLFRHSPGNGQKALPRRDFPAVQARCPYWDRPRNVATWLDGRFPEAHFHQSSRSEAVPRDLPESVSSQMHITATRSFAIILKKVSGGGRCTIPQSTLGVTAARPTKVRDSPQQGVKSPFSNICGNDPRGENSERKLAPIAHASAGGQWDMYLDDPDRNTSF